MGKLNVFTISLNSGRQVFYPGEQLSGHVIVELNEPKEVRGIKVEFEGKSYCHWSETKGTGDNKRTVSYTGRENLCEIYVPLYGMAGGGSRIVLPAGRQTYPFAINIPLQLPSSFEGSIGHIRYTLKAEIDRPWKFDHKYMVPIIINEVIDTNLPQYNIRPGGSVSKDVGCLCCAAGPLDMTGSIDRGCYCPGERILITADIQNHTTRDMDAVKAKLIQTITYHATNHHKTRTRSQTITKIQGAGIPQGEFAKWDNQALDLPVMPPTILNSRVINVVYYLQLEVAVPWGLDPDIKMPITIGTVPYRPVYGQQFQQTSNAPGIQADALPPPAYGAMAPPPPNVLGYADMAPPSYASVAGTSGSMCSENNVNYQPFYTFAQPSQVPITQQPGGYPPPQQQPGGFAPSPQQPVSGGYPAPPQQPVPGGYPAPQHQPGGYMPPMQGTVPPFQSAPIEQPPYNPNEAPPISKP